MLNSCGLTHERNNVFFYIFYGQNFHILRITHADVQNVGKEWRLFDLLNNRKDIFRKAFNEESIVTDLFIYLLFGTAK